MLGKQCRAIVVVARVACDNVRVALSWKWCNHIAEIHIGKPGCAVIGGLASPHPVARNSRVTLGATGALARVIPHGENSATGTDRDVRLPLRTRSGICVQLERRAKGHTAVGGTNVIDIARIATGAVLGIDQVNNAVQSGRFTPTLVPPEATGIGKHAGEVRVVAADLHARSRKCGTGECIGPGTAAVGGPENLIGVVVRETTTAFIHARDVDGSVARRIAGNLHIPNKAGVAHRYRRAPRCAVVSGEGDLESATANTEVVP